jgi:hypothetical protein
MFDNPGMVQSWKSLGVSMSPKFVALVEEILGEEPDRVE